LIVRKKNSTEVKAGFPWFGTWGRDTFMALPGLTLTYGDLETALEVIDSMVIRMKNGLFPNTVIKGKPAFNSVDAPLWFIWSVQQIGPYEPDFDVWKKYGKVIRNILQAYRDGSAEIVHQLDNGLLYAAQAGKPLTWMDAVVNGEPVTQRPGSPVEVNALWYNAVCQALEWSENRDPKFHQDWAQMPELMGKAFIENYWDEERGYLADFVNGSYRDFAVRPSQVIAVSARHSPLTLEMKKSILDVVESELLTPRGLRSLSPKNEEYKGTYEGNQEQRDRAYHQGTVWPWLLEHFVKGYLRVHKKSGYAMVKRIYDGFEDDLSIRGLGSISEIYDGNPPHFPRGSISQATGVAALLRIGEMIEGFNE
jgi:predicted glycogen debranching enzyme